MLLTIHSGILCALPSRNSPIHPSLMSSPAKITTGAAVGLALGMLITGSINTLSTKWADNTSGTTQGGHCAQRVLLASEPSQVEFSADSSALCCASAPATRRDDSRTLMHRFNIHSCRCVDANVWHLSAQTAAVPPRSTHELGSCLRCFAQAFGMFIGESMCLLAFLTLNWHWNRVGTPEKIERAASDLPWYIFAAPATCDLLGTSLMYLGLTYTAASTFQMLRGSGTFSHGWRAYTRLHPGKA